MSKLVLSILLFTTGHILIWFQLNGQFKWNWFDKKYAKAEKIEHYVKAKKVEDLF